MLDKSNNAGNLALATDATPAATLAWDGTTGDPTAGSLVVDAPFHAYNEYVNLQKGYANTNLQDWTGKTTLHVRVKIDSGLTRAPASRRAFSLTSPATARRRRTAALLRTTTAAPTRTPSQATAGPSTR